MDVQQIGKVELSETELAVPQSVHDMTDRELLMEIAVTLRLVGDFINQFQNMGPGDMMKMLLGR